MKKGFFVFGLTVLLGGFFTTIVSNPIGSEIISNKANGIKEYKVSSYQELESAIYDISNSEKDSSEAKIELTNDINLENFDGSIYPDYGSTGSTKNNYVLEGNGYSFYNKPKEYYFTPILSNLINSQPPINRSSVKVQNVVLDDAPVLFGTIMGVSDIDYNQNINSDELNQTTFMSNAVWFNNITITNTNLTDKTINMTANPDYWYEFYNGNFGLLGDYIRIFSHDNTQNDNGIYLGNIFITENKIVNNSINTSKSFREYSVSWLTNIGIQNNYLPYPNNQLDNVYIVIENISISNNEFYDNKLNISDQNATTSVSFGNILGELDFGDAQKSNQDGYITIKNISIQNNLYEQMEINAKNSTSSYSELIASQDIEENEPVSKDFKINEFENIFILNNLVYSNYVEKNSSKNVLMNSDNILDFNDVGNKLWINNAKNSMAFIGLNYDENEDLNLIANNSNSFGEILHQKYVIVDSKEYYNIETKMNELLGIYGYLLENELLDASDSSSEEILKQVIFPNKDTFKLLNWTPKYNDKNGEMIGIRLQFKFALGNTISFVDNNLNINKITIPLDLYNLTLKSSKQIITSTSLVVKTNADLGYVYSVDLDLNEQQMNAIDINDLFIQFEYINSNKSNEVFFVQINPDEIKNNGVIIPPTSSSTPYAIIISSTLLLLIILLLLLLLIIYLLRTYKDKKEIQRYAFNSNTVDYDNYYYFDQNQEYDYEEVDSNYDNYYYFDQEYDNQDNYFEYNNYYLEENNYDNNLNRQIEKYENN